MTVPRKAIQVVTAPRRPAPALPPLEIRFPAFYAWFLIVSGPVFLLLGVWFSSPLISVPKNPGFNLFLVVASLGAIVGGEYWRRHLPVMARMTPRQLVLRRGGNVAWGEIATIEKKTFNVRYRGNRGQSEFICIKLKTPRTPDPGLKGSLDKLRSAITGYDLIVPQSELSCTADYFIAECQKRLAASSALRG